MARRAKTPAEATVLVLRTCNADRTSHGGFLWPESGEVSAPDWDPTPCCGGGLHGLLWGEGGAEYLNWGEEAVWLAVQVLASEIVSIGGDKVKFPRGVVVYCGDRCGATDYIAANGGAGRTIHGHTATAGDSGTATAGDSGTATAGDKGTATARYSGTATAGNFGTATAGNFGTATAGNFGTATAGDSGTATAGDSGTATAGDSGTATAGDSGTATAGIFGTATAGNFGTATAGDSGTATAGDSGTATAGDSGTATAGNFGALLIRYWDAARQQYRIRCAEVGENGILPNVPYRLDGQGRFVRADEPATETAGAL